jgi:hypothetical protein
LDDCSISIGHRRRFGPMANAATPVRVTMASDHERHAAAASCRSRSNGGSAGGPSDLVAPGTPANVRRQSQGRNDYHQAQFEPARPARRSVVIDGVPCISAAAAARACSFHHARLCRQGLIRSFLLGGRGTARLVAEIGITRPLQAQHSLKASSQLATRAHHF